jgi:hypothetical protein
MLAFRHKSILKENLIIATYILNFNWCVEEFALQTICANYNEFYYLGNGTVTKILVIVVKIDLSIK